MTLSLLLSSSVSAFLHNPQKEKRLKEKGKLNKKTKKKHQQKAKQKTEQTNKNNNKVKASIGQFLLTPSKYNEVKSFLFFPPSLIEIYLTYNIV